MTGAAAVAAPLFAVPAAADLARWQAHAFLAPLGLGLNLERAAFLLPGVTPAYWRSLAQLGIGQVRAFCAWRPAVEMGGGGPGNAPPDAARIDALLARARAAIAAGLRVVMPACDHMAPAEAASPAVAAHLALWCERVLALGLPPAAFATGPMNEHMDGDNPTWNPIRARLVDLMRARLPQHVLVTGPAGWNGILGLLAPDYAVLPGPILHDAHHYGTWNWPGTARDLAAWSARHAGAAVMLGELGFGGLEDRLPDGALLRRSPAAWPALLAAMLPHMAAFRPALWAVTTGGDWAMNRAPADPRLRLELVPVVRQAAAVVRGALAPPVLAA